MFGASGGKILGYATGKVDDVKGREFKAAFLKAVPGFAKLVETLEDQYMLNTVRVSGRELRYIKSLVDTKVYVDSKHKLLVYLLQSCEKITCAAALNVAITKLREEGIIYKPLVFMHDEFQIGVQEKDAEKAMKICKEAFKIGPELYGIKIMDGDSKTGKNWMETH